MTERPISEVFCMDLQKIEYEALHLPQKDRAILIQKLVLSLDTPSVEELRVDWLSEARRRADELDDGSVQAVPGNEVLRKARALVQ
jgi:putative addiction module component (TIGR02574 family)